MDNNFKQNKTKMKDTVKSEKNAFVDSPKWKFFIDIVNIIAAVATVVATICAIPPVIKIAKNIDSFTVETAIRKQGDMKWNYSTDYNRDDFFEAKAGDIIEYQIHYNNTSNDSAINANNVMVKIVLPNNAKYIDGSTVLYNATNPDGIKRDDTIATFILA